MEYINQVWQAEVNGWKKHQNVINSSEKVGDDHILSCISISDIPLFTHSISGHVMTYIQKNILF